MFTSKFLSSCCGDFDFSPKGAGINKYKTNQSGGAQMIINSWYQPVGSTVGSALRLIPGLILGLIGLLCTFSLVSLMYVTSSM